jgi:hypothetical protein
MRRVIGILAAFLVVAGLSVAPAITAYAAYNSNTQEDNFLRPSQNGWGQMTNNDQNPTAAWFGDANGTNSYDTLTSHTGQMAFNGTANTPNFAGTGLQTNGGDQLAEISFSAVGHQVAYLAMNFCGDKSCGYEARIDTTGNEISLAKRTSGSTVSQAEAAFTATAGTQYWLRFNYDGSGHLKMKEWAAGTLEPSAWNLRWTDTGTLLGSNYSGIGSSQNQSTSAVINAYEYSFSSTPATPAVPPTLSQPFGTQAAGTSFGSNDPAGTYTVQENEFNSTATEVSATDDRPDVIVTQSQINNATNGAPGAYTSTYRGCHYSNCTSGSGLPIQVSSVETAGTVTTSVATNVISSGAWDDAYDIWFNNTSTGNQGTSGTYNLELMVWLQSLGGVQPAGSEVASNVSIGGRTYNVWFNGTANDTGGTVSYVLTSHVTSLSGLDLGPLASDAVSRHYMDTSWYLYDIEHGFELWNGGAGLAQTSFSVCDPTGC